MCSVAGFCASDVGGAADAVDTGATVDLNFTLITSDALPANAKVPQRSDFALCADGVAPAANALCEPGAVALDTDGTDISADVLSCPPDSCLAQGCPGHQLARKGLAGCVDTAAAEGTTFAVKFVVFSRAQPPLSATVERLITITAACPTSPYLFYCNGTCLSTPCATAEAMAAALASAPAGGRRLQAETTATPQPAEYAADFVAVARAAAALTANITGAVLAGAAGMASLAANASLAASTLAPAEAAAFAAAQADAEASEANITALMAAFDKAQAATSAALQAATASATTAAGSYAALNTAADGSSSAAAACTARYLGGVDTRFVVPPLSLTPPPPPAPPPLISGRRKLLGGAKIIKSAAAYGSGTSASLGQTLETRVGSQIAIGMNVSDLPNLSIDRNRVVTNKNHLLGGLFIHQASGRFCLPAHTLPLRSPAQC